ncbi:outer membrane protein [Sphingomonas qilianensis]|uniref:Outer membrane beta-barrel protein n=1 Tax=Sphingomonas qilianensis TaxID=1736690 RepID=A0ABU9XSQ9_9SPHN
MRKFALSAATGVLALGLAAPAFAQDVPVEAAPFTGPRVEAIAGYDHLGGENGSDGVVYGGQIGYDAQVGGVILGVEGELTGATTKSDDANVLAAGDRFRVKAGRDLYAGARLGYAISPVAMIYAKAGYTNAQIESRYTAGVVTIRDKEDAEGYRLGAGLEYKMSGNAYVKAEYRYSNYNNLDGGDVDIDLDRHQVLAGVGVRF